MKIKILLSLLAINMSLSCSNDQLQDDIDEMTIKEEVLKNDHKANFINNYYSGWNENIRYPSPDKDPQFFDIWLPEKRNISDTHLFVFIHGGSFTGGDKTDSEYIAAINAIKSQFPNSAIATINYRVGLTMLLDKPILDVQSALHYLIGQAPLMNISNNNIVLVGESAGAYLAFFEAFRRDSQLGNQKRYKAVVSLSGFAEIIPKSDSNTTFANLIALQALTVKIPNLNFNEYSPINRITNLIQANDFPEIYLFYGESDKVLSGSNSQNIYKKIQESGVQKYIDKSYIRSFPNQGHTMNASVKNTIAQILKQKLIF
ncbi:alpha/beta hydrolase [Chryseobacterium nematophagum]|uniref:Alpha/beta hydrolase n=1 Tax=Chryseobacterium nematophagum TaxID=2305228 RepID=A0A3M7TER4_9FLAO|nr:alpha/beta hydrolase [Chryseobacterium nematophagum]RNA60690.1 alpha/beta hydrolase [Chryseobacterium nematophagum]